MSFEKMSREELVREVESLQLRLKQIEDELPARAAAPVAAGAVDDSPQFTGESLWMALEASATGSFKVDLQTGAGQWNDVEFKLLGLRPGDVRPGPDAFFRYVHPEDHDNLQIAWEEATRSGVFDEEFRILRADGEVRWLAGKGGFLYAGGEQAQAGAGRGPATHFLGVNFDITERKHAEQALRQSEEIYRAIGESIDFGIWVCAPDGRNTYASKSFLELVGMTQEECSGFGWGKVLHPDDAQRTITAWQECVANKGCWDIEHRFRGVDGQWHPILARGVPVLDDRGEVTCWVGINLDIQRLKEAEAVVRRNEERLNLALDAAHLATWDWHLASGTLAWNREHYRMLGYEPDSFVPTYAHWADRIHPDDLPSTELLIRQSAERAQDYRAEYRVRLPDGRVRNLEALGHFEKDEAGNAVRLYGVMSDITEQKKLLAELRQVNDRLEQSVAERTAELSLTNDRLEQEAAERKQAEAERLNLERHLMHTQKLESMGVLAGGIAHEFNNILTAIVGNADLALMRINPESPVVDNLNQIERAAARATDLAKQMLAYSGKGKFVIETLDMNRLLQEMVHMLEVAISKNARLRFNLAPDLPTMEADATQMRQVVMNLVINASEAIGDGDGVIAISTARIEYRPGLFEDVRLAENLDEGSYVCLEVTDSGCGMSREVIDKIFDPFFTTKFTGRGLGMAAMLGIVRGHRGAIVIHSEPGQGSTFKVLLPADGHVVKTPAGEVPHDEGQGQGTILLVDDEEMVRNLGAEMLKELGYTAITARDGCEAVATFRETPGIDAVILDLTMPKMGGEQCFKELSQIKPDVKVIISSGYSEQDITQRFKDKGLAGFLQKPFYIASLQDALQALFGGS